MKPIKKPIFNSKANQSYLDAVPRLVPGLDGLHRMTSMLLAEKMPSDGRVLVLGAGGGLELKYLADAHSQWTFDGVDPSEEMLKLAKTTVEPHGSRIKFHTGTIEAAPDAMFDCATCILVFHFIPLTQRLETLKQIRRRLKVGAPLVLAHVSFPQTEPERSQWIARHVAFGMPDDADPASREGMHQAIASQLTILAPEEEEAMLQAAGFTGISLFYAGFSFKGWVAYA
ncbi:MAG: class I SAM-dependent methyltransferase [Hyphomicrobiales bacterium]